MKTKKVNLRNRRFDPEKKKKAVAYAKEHGPFKAAKKFKTTPQSIYNWTKGRKTPLAKKGKRAPKIDKRKAINYAKRHGVQDAAKKFKTTADKIREWRRAA